jgi:hypothetical protein
MSPVQYCSHLRVRFHLVEATDQIFLRACGVLILLSTLVKFFCSHARTRWLGTTVCVHVHVQFFFALASAGFSLQFVGDTGKVSFATCQFFLCAGVVVTCQIFFTLAQLLQTSKFSPRLCGAYFPFVVATSPIFLLDYASGFCFVLATVQIFGNYLLPTEK